PVTALAVSRDGLLVATGTAAGEVRLWDTGDAAQAAPRAVLQPAGPGVGHPVRQLAFAGNDQRVVALCRDEAANKTSARGWSIRPPENGDGPWTATPAYDLA